MSEMHGGFEWDAVASMAVKDFAATPAAVVGAARRHGSEWRAHVGAAGRLWSQGAAPAPSADAHTVFDLASLTKPVTALTFARCERHGLIRRDTLLGEILPELRDSPAGRASFDLLMAHRAGLVAHRELFVKQAGAPQQSKRDALMQAAQLARPGCEAAATGEGYPPIYSDLGYMLTGAALERCSGQPLDELMAGEVGAFLPPEVCFGSARQLRERHEHIAPTERVEWRGGVLRAIVHDENAWVLAGEGSAGHAGLFGDVAAVTQIGCLLLDALAGRAADWLEPSQLAPLLRVRPGGSHRAGFDSRSDANSSCGRHFSASTFGHLGFTGTSLWVDPAASIVGVLLTNRVHPSRDHIAIRKARPAVYDALYQALFG